MANKSAHKRRNGEAGEQPEGETRRKKAKHASKSASPIPSTGR
jgi:hypothetical protein